MAGSVLPSVSRWEIDGRKRDWRFFFFWIEDRGGKGQLFPLDRGRGGLEDRVWCKLADGSLHRRGVEVCQGCFVGVGVCPPIGEQVGDRWEESGLEGLLFGSGTGG